MKRFRLLLFLIVMAHFSTVNSYSQITADEALSKFVAAGMAYQDGQYVTAIARYREILDGGRESGAVYYNLGNSYFHNKEIGKALLNYERAKRLIPRDSDLNYNYRYVRARADNYSDENESFFSRAVINFVQFYTVDEMTLMIAGLIFAIGMVFLLFQWMGWSRSFHRGIIALLVLILAIYAVGLNIKIRLNKDCAIVVMAGESYFEPRTDSTMHFKLPEGMQVEILKSEGNWVKIQRLDGKVGWTSRDVLEEI